MPSSRLWYYFLLLILSISLIAQGQIPAPASNTDEPGIKERIIYVPYRELESLLPSKDTGIYVSYQEYRQLLEELEKLKQRPPELPTQVVITDINYKSKAAENFLEVQAVGNVHILKEGWHILEMKFDNIAIKEAKWNNEPALLKWSDNTYQLIFYSQKPDKGQFQLSFMVPITKDQQPNLIAKFNVPRAPIAQLDLEIPSQNESKEIPRIKVQVEPSLALDVSTFPGLTKAKALLGNTNEVKISWQTEAERKVEIKNILHAENLAHLEVGENFLQHHARIRYDLIQGDVQELQFKIPEGFRIFSVNALLGGSIREWNSDESNTTLTVSLNNKIVNQAENKADFEIEIKLEKIIKNIEEKISLPSIEILDVEREKGFYTIFVNDIHTLKILERKDITQMDVQDLPEYAKQREAHIAFKYLKRPFSLLFELEKKEPEYEVVTNVFASLDETLYKLYSHSVYDIKKSRIFGTKIEIPAGFILLDAKAYDLAGNEKNVDQIKEYRELDEQDKHILSIVFKKGLRSSKFVVRLELQKKFTQEEKERIINLPVFAVQGAKRETGNIGISVKSSFNITTIDKSQKNVSALEANELFKNGERPFKAQNINIGLQYFELPIAAEFKVEKRDPLVTAEIYNYVDIAENLLTHTFYIYYDVKYTGVKEVAFSLPIDIAKQVPQTRVTEVTVSDNPIKEIAIVANEEKKITTYTIQTQREILSKYEIKVVYEKKIDPMAADQSHEIFELATLNTKRESGFIIFKKNNNLSLDFSNIKGMETTDIHDPNFTRGSKEGIFAVFKYSNLGYQISLLMKKLKFEAVINTVIQRLHISSTVNKDFSSKNEAVILLINNRNQMLEFEVPEGSRITSVSRLKTKRDLPNDFYTRAYKIDSYLESLTWAHADKPRCFKVNIASNVGEKAPLTLIIKYETSLKKGEMGYYGNMTIPSISFGETPVTYFTWELGLPNEYQYTWFESNLNQNFILRCTLWRVLSEMLQKCNVDETVIQQDAETGVIPIYPVEGRKYGFYRLNGDGYIHIQYLYYTLLNTLHLGVFIIIAGLLLLAAKFQVRILPVMFILCAISLIFFSINLQGYQDLYLTILVTTLVFGSIIGIVRFFRAMGEYLQKKPAIPNKLFRSEKKNIETVNTIQSDNKSSDEKKSSDSSTPSEKTAEDKQ